MRACLRVCVVAEFYVRVIVVLYMRGVVICARVRVRQQQVLLYGADAVP